jgi:hypothetical protein
MYPFNFNDRSESDDRMIIIISLYVITAGAQAFLMDYLHGKRATTHHAGPMRIGGC